MAKAGTNAGMVQWCTRLAIQAGIQARSLGRLDHADLVHAHCNPGLTQAQRLHSIGITGQSIRTLYRFWRRESWRSKSYIGWIDSQTLVQAFGLFCRSDHLVHDECNTCLRARDTALANASFCRRQCSRVLDGCLPSRTMPPKRRSCSSCRAFSVTPN